MLNNNQHVKQSGNNLKFFHPATLLSVTCLSGVLLLAQFTPAFARRPLPVPPVRRIVRPPVRFVPAPSPVRRIARPPVRFVPVPPPVRRIVRPPVGRILPALPLGYAALMVANQLYYYHAGSFYRRRPNGYTVINAPVGAVVPTLPSGHNFLIIDGVRYYSYAGHYYLQSAGGYQVIADPTRRAVQPVTNNRVVVTTRSLNVRTGPGLRSPILTVVHSGDILHVLRRRPNWMYVQLPNYSYGWIMTRFTAPVNRRVDG